MKDVKTAIDAQLAVAEEIKSDFITLTTAEGKRILKLLKKQKGSWDYGTQCSVCKGTIIPPQNRKTHINFCPWCGADMRDSYED